MTFVPTPVRALLGLAATAVDEIKKLDQTLPEAATSVPVAAVSFLMQTSMKVQQQIAEYATRGDEVLSHLRGFSDEPPSWATFDDDEPAPTAPSGTGARKAAFDEVDLDGLDLEEDLDDLDDDAVDLELNGLADTAATAPAAADTAAADTAAAAPIVTDPATPPQDSDEPTHGSAKKTSPKKAPAKKSTAAKKAAPKKSAADAPAARTGDEPGTSSL